MYLQSSKRTKRLMGNLSSEKSNERRSYGDCVCACVCACVCSVASDSFATLLTSLPGSFVHRIFPSGCYSCLQGTFLTEGLNQSLWCLLYSQADSLQMNHLKGPYEDCPSGDLPDPGVKPRPAALQADSSLSEPPGKPMNTGLGSLSLLQGIFPT